MKYWFASSNRDNWEIIRQKNIWGIPKRNRSIIDRVTPGDAILIYLAQQKDGDEILPSAVAGAFEIVSEGYEDSAPLFVTPERMGDEVFPYRVRLKPIKIFKEPVEFKPLIPKLSFITNKTMWTGHIRVAMREIPEEDYHLFLNRG
ncbi:MAG: EVE domain-containing protein [Methanocalculus sp. MSAO_Arc2]|uniref:EVE domain-containing protein n=1 Tax=Methanocalculus sp. MSAO_Arc2 TaxID=2293855 RepID=UPI000FF66909|nr:MAG: EVE domain-containing protein [Methanocalculus sp. MSAO_Arc2]